MTSVSYLDIMLQIIYKYCSLYSVCMHITHIVYLILRVIVEKFIKDIQSLMLIDSQNLTIIDNNTLEIKIPKGISYMDRVLKDLPKGVFIDKQVCAVGGTSLAIKSPTNYVIAAHRKILVDNKYKQHSDKLIKVEGGVKPEDIIKEIKKGKNKIITTYDSLGKVAVALEQLNLLDDFHLIVDEVQNVIREGGDFREEVCNALLENTCKFASVSYLTATSTKRKYLPEEIKDIPYLKLVWEGSININVKQKHVTGDLTEVITNIAVDHLDNKHKGEAYFFFNSVKGITPVIKNLMKLRKATSKDIKVICADNEENRKVLSALGKDFIPDIPVYGVDEYGKPIVRNKQITFITKTCFEGVDFYSDYPVTYIVSDARNKHKHFVKTDIAVDIRQIAGRFRTGDPMARQEATLLWTGQYDGFDLPEDEFEKFVLAEIEKTETTIQMVKENKIIDSLSTAVKTSKYLTKRDGEIVLNKLAFSNIMSDYATQKEDFKIMIDDFGNSVSVLEEKLTKLYDVDSYEPPEMTLLDKGLLGKKLNFRQLAENYYEAKVRLKGCEDSSIDCTIEDINSFRATIETTEALCKRIVEYVDTLGLDALKSCGFQESKVKRKYESTVGVTKLVASPKRIQRKTGIKPDTFLTMKEGKDLLQKAYDELKINEVAKANHLERYFPTKRCKRNGVVGYLIIDEKQMKEF